MSIRRPSLTVAQQKDELARKLVELVDAFNSLGTSDPAVELELPDVGPGAGVYGGGNTFIDSVTLDDKGRVTGISSDVPDSGVAPTSLRSFRHLDQGGAFSAASTRVHWAGMHGSNAGQYLATANSNAIQAAAGGMAYAYPETFDRNVTITRLVTRTNGRSGAAGGNLRMAVYENTVLTSGAFTGDDYPGVLLGESAAIAYPAGANLLMETVGLSIDLTAGQKYWFTWVQDAAGVTGAYAICCYPAGGLFPFGGFTLDATTPTTIADDNATQGVCWRHSITFTGAESFPDPFPQSSIVMGAGGLTIVHPAVGFGYVLQ